MLKTRFSMLGAAAIVAGLAICAVAGSASAQGFSAPLVQCQSVTTPAALTTCASSQDSLKSGGAAISDQGDVTVTVVGAPPNTTYAVTFVNPTSTPSSISIGTFKTGSKGNGAFRKDAYFKIDTVGAGNIVVNSTVSSGAEFVSGVLISSNGLESGRDFQPALVRCTDTTVPGTLSSCGSDSLSAGHVDVENPDGAMSIHISGARPSTTYTATFVSPNGAPMALGSVGPTDRRGNASADFNTAFSAGTIGFGSVVLASSGTVEFESGFKVDEKFVSPQVSTSNLVPCGSVTNPTDLNCGDDPLDSGNYEVAADGDISVTLKGAQAGTNYEVYFRPLDYSGDVDTGIVVPTNKLGNARVNSKPYFTPDTVNSGTLVLKHQGSDQPDQFVAGFEVH